MSEANACPECGAALAPGQTCDELFGTVLAWEGIDPPRTYANHHILVMSWELQHPSRFSEEALAWIRESLRRVLTEGVTPQDLRRESTRAMQQQNRAFKITRSGAEIVPRAWSRTLSDVIAEGSDAMPDSVGRWARAVACDLGLAG
jgi:hypothetical protein